MRANAGAPVTFNTTAWLANELAPFPGRLATACQVAAVCAITALLFMTYQIPLVAIGCYLVIFVTRPNTAETLLMSMAICVLVSLVVVVLVFLLPITLNHPVARMAVLAGSSVLFVYLGAASRLGPVGNIVALVIAFVMTLLGNAPFGEVATRGLLYAWLMALVPMGVLLVYTAAFGRPMVRGMQLELARREQAVALLQNDPGAYVQVRDLLRAGNESLEKTGLFLRLFRVVSPQEQQRLMASVEQSYDRLVACAGRHLRGRGEQPAAAQPGDVAVADLSPKKSGLPGNDGFFYADALSNPVYVQFALKTTLAAVICYVIYTALQWQDIHTAMITCYVAALGTTAETVHKLTLRIVGCLIGAAMGVLSVLFLIPQMTTITSLMGLVFAGVLVAGWVSAGSERSAYAGVQIGLAFLLTVLQGFGPDVSVSVAMDRVAGILLGNVVLYVIFTRAWPVSAAVDVGQRLQALATPPASPGGNKAPAALLPELDRLRNQLALIHFEPSSLRPGDEDVARLRARLDAAESACILSASTEEHNRM